MSKKNKINETLINLRLAITWLATAFCAIVGYGFVKIEELSSIKLTILAIVAILIAILLYFVVKLLIAKTNGLEEL